MSKKVKIKVPEEEDVKGVHVDVRVDDEADSSKEAETENEDDASKASSQDTGAKDDASGEDHADPLQAKIDELNDKVMRQMAEFENYRKRTEKEKAQNFEAGAASVLTKILPVIDNFERGFDMVEEADRDDAFVDGMNKVYKQLMTELEKIGVVPIDALGKEFDPAFHNAVMQTEEGEADSGTIVQEMQKGYMYNETVLRHSMVSVKA